MHRIVGSRLILASIAALLMSGESVAAQEWINRNRNYQPPNNDGRDSVLLGVINEPECVFENVRWIVEGNTQAGEAIAEFDAICVGFERPVPTVVRDAFVIEDGRIKEIRVIFTLVGPNP